MKLEHLVAIAILGTAGYFFFKKQPLATPQPSPAIAQIDTKGIDPQKVKNRHEVIRFYERAIMDLKETISQKSTVNTRGTSATNYDPCQTRSSSAHSAARNAHSKQIEEYKRRIAAMKAEIGE